MYKTIISLLFVLGLHYTVAESQTNESNPQPDCCPDKEVPIVRYKRQTRQGVFIPNQVIPTPQTQAPTNNPLQAFETLLFLRILDVDLGKLLRRLLGRDDFDHEDEDWYEATNDCFYKFFTEKVTYIQARDKCKDKDARLASSKGIYDADIRGELVSTSFEFPNNWDDVWIGLDSLLTQDVFVWSDGVTIANSDSIWPGIGPPSTGTGDCVALISSSRISGQDCGIQEHYLCEHCP